MATVPDKSGNSPKIDVHIKSKREILEEIALNTAT